MVVRLVEDVMPCSQSYWCLSPERGLAVGEHNRCNRGNRWKQRGRQRQEIGHGAVATAIMWPKRELMSLVVELIRTKD